MQEKEQEANHKAAETRWEHTNGCVIELLGCPSHLFSRTLGTIATPSGESELYVVGPGVSSTSEKAISTREDVTKLVKHIGLRSLYMCDAADKNMSVTLSLGLCCCASKVAGRQPGLTEHRSEQTVADVLH